MKNYTITVNGVAYDVVVEEKGAGAAVAAPQRQLRSSTGTGSSSEGSSSRGSRRSSSKGFRTGQGTEGRGKCRTGSEVR